jgi:hypothetical protein
MKLVLIYDMKIDTALIRIARFLANISWCQILTFLFYYNLHTTQLQQPNKCCL